MCVLCRGEKKREQRDDSEKVESKRERVATPVKAAMLVYNVWSKVYVSM